MSKNIVHFDIKEVNKSKFDTISQKLLLPSSSELLILKIYNFFILQIADVASFNLYFTVFTSFKKVARDVNLFKYIK